MKILFLNIRFWGKISIRFIAYLIFYAFALAEACLLMIPRSFLIEANLWWKILGVTLALATIFFPLIIHDTMRSAYRRERQWYDFDRRFI